MSYWYLTTVWYCPVCGHEDRIRERQYTLKPVDTRDTMNWKDVWDGCDAL